MTGVVNMEAFFTRENGRLCATPLLLCLVCVEMADVMFAFDSVPAVIAVTQKPFLVYTSNIFAILGLRSLYFLLAAAKRSLHHLEKAVIGILVFIGAKMLLDVTGLVHVSAQASLAVVAVLLFCGVAGSWLAPEPLPETARLGLDADEDLATVPLGAQEHVFQEK